MTTETRSSRKNQRDVVLRVFAEHTFRQSATVVLTSRRKIVISIWLEFRWHFPDEFFERRTIAANFSRIVAPERPVINFAELGMRGALHVAYFITLPKF